MSTVACPDSTLPAAAPLHLAAGKAEAAVPPPVMGGTMVIIVEPDMTVQLGKQEEVSTDGSRGAPAAEQQAREAGEPPSPPCVSSQGDADLAYQ